MKGNGGRRKPPLSTWYCIECAREGKPYVYVRKSRKRCPSGHVRKGA